jgi:hypothetical protein
VIFYLDIKPHSTDPPPQVGRAFHPLARSCDTTTQTVNKEASQIDAIFWDWKRCAFVIDRSNGMASKTGFTDLSANDQVR